MRWAGVGGVCGGSGADSRGIIEGDGCSGFNTGAITEAVRMQVLPQMLPGPSFLDGACVTGGSPGMKQSCPYQLSLLQKLHDVAPKATTFPVEVASVK